MSHQDGAEPSAQRVPRRSCETLLKARSPHSSPNERRRQEDALVARFGRLPGFAEATSVLLFVSALPEEPPTIELFSLAYEMKKTVLCPRVDERATAVEFASASQTRRTISTRGNARHPRAATRVSRGVARGRRLGARSGPGV